MKIPSFLKTRTSLRKAITASSLGLFILSSSTKAAVVITFSQTGADVIGVMSGSMAVPPVSARIVDDVSRFGPELGGGPLSLYILGIGFPSYDLYGGGVAASSGLSIPPSNILFAVDSIGYSSTDLVFGSNVTPGSTYSPVGTWIWFGQTLGSIGLGSLTTQTVYTSATNDTIVFTATPVPEPSTALFAGIGLGLFFMRRRNT